MDISNLSTTKTQNNIEGFIKCQKTKKKKTK
jgi:hypothetical protein